MAAPGGSLSARDVADTNVSQFIREVYHKTVNKVVDENGEPRIFAPSQSSTTFLHISEKESGLTESGWGKDYSFNERGLHTSGIHFGKRAGRGNQAFTEQWKKIRPAFEKLGIKIDQEAEENATSITEDNRIKLHISPDALSGRERTAFEEGKLLGVASSLTLGEEFIHAVHLSTLREDWLARGARGTLRQYVMRENQKIFADMQRTINSASPQERQYLLQALRDSYNLYYKKFSSSSVNTDIESVFSEIQSRNLSVGFVAEFIRQASQLKRQGRLNEEFRAGLLPRLREWVKRAIQRIKQALPGAYEGKFGDEIRQMLVRIDAILDDVNAL